jgi:hypothetical protein
VTPRDPESDALERYTQPARARLVAGWDALRAFPAQLSSESRLFWSDWRAPRAEAPTPRPAFDAPDEHPPELEPEQLELEGLESQRGVPHMPGATTIVAERDDDANSIIGRIDAASEVELLLVVPRRARELRDAMAWPRIAAHVRQRGLALRVLASRREVRQHAEDAGLPAARTVRGLRPRRSLRLPLGGRDVLLHAPSLAPLLKFAGFVAVVAALFGGAAFYVPSAEIVVAPPTQPLSSSLRVRLNPVAETDIGGGVVAATSVNETIVSVVSTATTGTATVGDLPAAVELVFTNSGQAEINLPIGTPVDDEGGFTFTTNEAVTVPAGETATVAATSIRPGTGGNLEADALRLLIGFPPTLTVTNPEPALGGTDTDVPAAGAEDVVRVGRIAEEVLRRAGERELLRIIEGGTVFIETVSVVILSQEPLVQVGEPADAFLMEYTAIVSALVLTADEARRAGEQLLVASLPDGMALLPGTTEATAVASSYDGSRLIADLTATGLATPLIDPASLRGELTGVSPSTAAARLREQLALDEEPLIRVYPSWLPDWRMPQREGRISIALVSHEALAAEIAGEPKVADGAEQPDGGAAEDAGGE